MLAFRSLRAQTGFREFSQSYTQKCWQVLKKETKKVFQGCKLLAHDAKFLIRKKYMIYFNDQQQTIKQKKAMARTSSDLLKMFPFSVFIIIPGAELLLPPVLYIFPNMIPSTFLSKSKQQDILNSIAEKRPIYADKLHRFLIQAFKKQENSQSELFLKKMKNKPQEITRKDLIDNYQSIYQHANFSKMDPDLLRATCRFLCMQPWTGFKTISKLFFAPISKILGYFSVDFPKVWNPKIFPLNIIQKNILMVQFRRLMKKVRNQDVLLLIENIDNIESELLVTLCRERAIQTVYTTEQQMKKDLKEWVVSSTHPFNIGLLRGEILLFGQVFQYIQDRIDEVVEEEKSQEAESPLMIFEESMDRILHYEKKEIEGLIQSLEEKDVQQLSEQDREELIDRLEEILDENLMMEESERVEKQLDRLEDECPQAENPEGPVKN